MVRMHDIRRTASDVKAEKKAYGGESETAYVAPEDDGARFELEHHHLTKLGLHGDLKSGDALHFHGHGTVERSESRSTPDGDKHSATIRFQRGGVEHQPADGDERKDIRADIERAASDKKTGGKA